MGFAEGTGETSEGFENTGNCKIQGLYDEREREREEVNRRKDMPQISDRVQTFTDSVIRRMTRISNKYNAINLSQGFPDFNPPEELKNALAEAALKGPHQYSITYGADNFRQALAIKQGRAISRDIDPETEIVVTCGGTEAMICAMMTMWGILSVLCLGYSFIVYCVGSGTFSFVIWLALAGFFAVLWFVAGKDRYKKIPKPVKSAAGIVIILACAIFIVCQACILSHFFDKGEKDLDYIIVLGAQMRESDPSVIYRERLDAAYEYLTENEDTVCIVSGGQGTNESMPEGEGGRDYLISKGIDEGRLIAEKEAMDTVENIEYSYDIIKDMNPVMPGVRIGIVTNNFHLFRGIHIAEKITDADICGIAAYTEHLYLPNNMVRECFGIVRDCIL